MFVACRSLKNIDVSNWVTTSATKMWGMFQEMDVLESLDLRKFKFDKVTGKYLDQMFYKDISLKNIYVESGTDLNNGSRTADKMFIDCINLPNYNGATTNITKANDSATGYFTSLESTGIWYHKVNGVWKQGQRYTKKNGI